MYKGEQKYKLGRREFLGAVGSASSVGVLVASEGRGGRTQKEVDSKKTTRIGLIGCGGRGTALGEIIERLNAEGEPVEITAVCDVYRPRLERATARWSAKPYAKSVELIRDANVDAVIIATPDRLHAFQTIEAARARKDVYCEKPLTHWRQPEKLTEMVEAVKGSGIVFQIGAQRLSDKTWKEAAQIIQSGGIGKPVHVQMGYCIHGVRGDTGMPIDDPKAQAGLSLNWEAFLADAPPCPFSVSRFFRWRMYMDYAGGPCTDNNVHFLILIIRTLGLTFPKNVVALGGIYFYGDGEREVPDTFDMIAQYPQDLSFTFVGTYCNDHVMETAIRGTEATLTLPSPETVVARIEPEAGSTKGARALGNWDVGHDHMLDFVRCVQTREKPIGDIDLAYHTQILLNMAMRSFVERKVVSFDLASHQITLS
jgi:predicted dehydrogenase